MDPIAEAAAAELGGRVVVGASSKAWRWVRSVLRVPTVLPDPESTYSVVCNILEGMDKSKRRREFMLAAIHGTSDVARTDSQGLDPSIDRYDALMHRIATSPKWRAKIVFNITSAARLDQITLRLNQFKNCDGFEVRALVDTDAIPALRPLIVGDRHVFLGVDDERYYRVRTALHLTSKQAARFMRSFFLEVLWNAKGIHILKDNNRVFTEVIEKLKKKFGHVPRTDV